MYKLKKQPEKIQKKWNLVTKEEFITVVVLIVAGTGQVRWGQFLWLGKNHVPLHTRLFSSCPNFGHFMSRYSSDEIVEDRICTGTECKEIKSSTSDKRDNQVNGKGTVPNTTPGTN